MTSQFHHIVDMRSFFILPDVVDYVLFGAAESVHFFSNRVYLSQNVVVLLLPFQFQLWTQESQFFVVAGDHQSIFAFAAIGYHWVEFALRLFAQFYTEFTVVRHLLSDVIIGDLLFFFPSLYKWKQFLQMGQFRFEFPLLSL